MDSDMPDATSSESEPSASDPPTPSPPIVRPDFRRESHSARHYQRSDPYSLRDHVKPRRKTVSILKPPLSKGTVSPSGSSNAGDILILDNHSPPFLFPYRDREVTPSKDPVPSSSVEPLSGLGTEVAQRLKGTVDKLRGFSLAELIPPRNEPGSQRKQSIPAISQLVQEAKSFTTTESFGEGEMHAKMRLSKSCNEMCLPPLLTSWQLPGNHEKTPDGSLDITPPEISDLLTLKSDESASPSADPSSVFRAGSVDELEYPAMSPVGFFTTPASPRSPAGRPRSGSQSPYRRTYSNSSSKGVYLKQGVLGKRKAESDDERDSDKRVCLNLGMSSGSLDMDVQTGDL
ncbi:hypothetical protein BV898_07491 [Hypsibius exemplaris]|uniref:Uncharacterized protein n=1 Tax=Hypsibius exemplaris TaxID=2072580 RepID=A0A1W0WTG1_HYPEX|nr:hypothetical protein BV898_07491 [Hypsibius exemplaris]